MSTLQLVIGPMFAGKTSLLIERYNDALLYCSSDEILVINHVFDSYRYKNNKVVSHDGIEISAISINKLCEIDNLIGENIKYIFINEGQFFEDLYRWTTNILNTTNIQILICGIDSDYKQEKIGEMWNLIPHAHYIDKIYGKCNNCTSNSLYTHRIIENSENNQVVIGSTNYIPLCRKCYNQANQ